MTYQAILVHAPKTNEYYPPFGEYDFIILLPAGLFSIADYAERSGHPTRILHLGIARELNPSFSLPRLVGEMGVHTVGFSLHWHHQAADVMREVAALRAAHPSLRIVLGGFTASYFAAEIMEKFEVDAVCRGEGERSFVEILARPPGAPLAGIPNLVWRDGPQIVSNPESHVADSDQLNCYRYYDPRLLLHSDHYQRLCHDPWFQMRGLRRTIQNRWLLQDPRLFPLTLLRGCVLNCSFCGGARETQQLLCGRRQLGIVSAECALATAQDAARAGFTSLFFDYLNPPAADREAGRFAMLLAGKRLYQNLLVECRNAPSEDFLLALGDLVRAGTRVHIHLSPDCADETQRRRHKEMAISDQQISSTLALCAKLGISVEIYFILGLPGEAENEPELLVAKARELLSHPGAAAVKVQSVTLEPGSPMFEHPERFNIQLTVRTLADYIRLHGARRFPPDLGYTFGEEPALFQHRIQGEICRRFCRIGNQFSSHQSRWRYAITSACSGFCRTLLVSKNRL